MHSCKGWWASIFMHERTKTSQTFWPAVYPNAKQSTRKWDMIERLFKFLLLSVASIFKKIYGIKFKVKPVTIELSNERMVMKTARNLLTAGHQGSGYIISFFRWLKEWFFSYRWHTQKRVLKLLHRYVSCLWR